MYIHTHIPGAPMVDSTAIAAGPPAGGRGVSTVGTIMACVVIFDGEGLRLPYL